MNEKANLTFSFDGGYEVDAVTFARTISALVEMTTAFAEDAFQDVRFGLTVRAIEKGSVKFDYIATVLAAAQQAFAPAHISYASDLISLISSAFSVKKFLKGRNPASRNISDGEIIIKNAEGREMRIPAKAAPIFVDQRIDKSVTAIIDSARSSPYVTGLTITSDRDVNISREEFDSCAEPLDVEELESGNYIISRSQNAVLFIRQPDFTGDLQWKFRGEQNITASVKDEAFKRRVQDGDILISSQTYIIADLSIKTPISSAGVPDTAHAKYEVVEVHEIHTPGEGQTSLEM